jgi:threonine dehydratase
MKKSRPKTAEDISLKHIQEAAETLKGITIRTPTISAPWLNNLVKGEVFLKLENLQITGSFKARGSYIKLSKLTEEERARGIITMSAGNHALGIAYHSQKLGIPATIVMPKNTAIAKVERTRGFGVAVILQGENMTESRDFTMQLMKKHNYTLIHPFNDLDVIAGQGTVALEMLEDVPDLDILIVPIGGGGLAAGMAIAAKAIKPDIQVIGVQAAFCTVVAQALFPNAVPSLPTKIPQTIAEGIAIRFSGNLTMAILEKYLDDMFVAEEQQIEDAIEALILQNKIVAEGAGAVGLAVVLANPEIFEKKKVGIVISGGNIDSRILSSLLLRGLVHSGKLIRFKIESNDTPGILGDISKIIGKAGGNIFEISHQRLFNHIAVKMAYVDAVVETRSSSHALDICNALVAGGFPAVISES